MGVGLEREEGVCILVHLNEYQVLNFFINILFLLVILLIAVTKYPTKSKCRGAQVYFNSQFRVPSVNQESHCGRSLKSPVTLCPVRKQSGECWSSTYFPFLKCSGPETMSTNQIQIMPKACLFRDSRSCDMTVTANPHSSGLDPPDVLCHYFQQMSCP